MNLIPHSKGARAFSLIELLVVLGILSILVVVATVGIRGDDGTKLNTAQGLVIGQIQSARNTALARNEPCRLLIDAGEGGGRHLGLATLSASGKWEMSGTMVELPEGTAVLVGDGESPSTTRGGSAIIPSLLVSGDVVSPASLAGKEWYYFEFDPAGTSEANSGAIVVLGAVRPEGSGHQRKSGELIRGVMIRRTGHASAFLDPSHIREAFDAL